ncbi:MAG TPA: lamin tail domain-containing protein [Longilinea sp.]|jgi:hypothetical protein|nr:lamin tail domain-containing protein [Longilinea sp.]
MKLKRSLPFILLNILVSATTTLLVIFIWDSTHTVTPITSSVETTPSAITQISPGSLAACNPSIPNEGEEPVVIQNILGAGDITREVVELRRTGSETLCLNGWSLRDADNNEYEFPRYYQLYSDGVVFRLYTRSGTDTALELYWGQGYPVWSTGEELSLRDPDGNVQATFTVP